MKDLSVIVVSYNTKKLLKDCLACVVKYTKEINYEIVVVDNASTDGSVETIDNFKSQISDFKIIKNKKNLGFSKANNQGIKKSKGRYVLLLNSDTLIKENVLGEMVSWMDENKKVGIASCALKNKDGSEQGTGGYFPHLFKVFTWMFFLEDIPFIDRIIKPFHPMHSQSPFYKGERHFLTPHQKDWMTGAFFLIRKEVIEKVGLLDEDYFMYVEELDFCYRAKKAGWQVWFLPKWSITHLGGASSTTEFSILSEYKGMKLFYKKHKPSWQMPFLRIFLKGGSFLRIMIFGVIKGKEVAKVYAKAFMQA